MVTLQECQCKLNLKQMYCHLNGFSSLRGMDCGLSVHTDIILIPCLNTLSEAQPSKHSNMINAAGHHHSSHMLMYITIQHFAHETTSHAFITKASNTIQQTGLQTTINLICCIKVLHCALNVLLFKLRHQNRSHKPSNFIDVS